MMLTDTVVLNDCLYTIKVTFVVCKATRGDENEIKLWEDLEGFTNIEDARKYLDKLLRSEESETKTD